MTYSMEDRREKLRKRLEKKREYYHSFKEYYGVSSPQKLDSIEE